MEDAASLGRLIGALRPWLGHLVIVGGWAHRLYRSHPLAGDPAHPPVRTRDVDLALSLHAPLAGDIAEALTMAGFGRTFIGDNAPPVTHYYLEDDAGFYAEFLMPLHGGEFTRRGQRDVTVKKAGITAQKLRYLDVLLGAPWSVHFEPDSDIPLEYPTDVLLPNPVSFIIQKMLIHGKRPPNKRAQDLLYIHDTLELFGGALDDLRTVWRDQVRPSLAGKTANRAETQARALFANVSDTIREAARIPEARTLSPENLRAACEYGLAEILNS